MPTISMFYGIIIRLYFARRASTIRRTFTRSTTSSKHRLIFARERLSKAPFRRDNASWFKRGRNCIKKS